MSIHAIDLARSPNCGEADPARFGEYAVNIHTSSSCRSPNRRKGQLHVPPPLAHANVLVYELILKFVVRRVLITLELVYTQHYLALVLHETKARVRECVCACEPCRHLCLLCRACGPAVRVFQRLCLLRLSAVTRNRARPLPMLGAAGACGTSRLAVAVACAGCRGDG